VLDEPCALASGAGFEPYQAVAVLVMACGAVLCRSVLAMAAQARAHGVLYQKLGGRCLRHVAVANGAPDVRACVRSVLKLHQRFAWKAVDALPRDFPFGRRIGGQLPNPGFGRGQFGMAEHALSNGGNPGGPARVRGDVAIDTLQAEREVLLMGIRDRLRGWRRHGSDHQDRDNPSCAAHSPLTGLELRSQSLTSGISLSQENGAGQAKAQPGLLTRAARQAPQCCCALTSRDREGAVPTNAQNYAVAALVVQDYVQ
jgi:hypothetical protein